MENLNKNLAMGWDDAIEQDGQEFLLLKEGDYIFTVSDFNRAMFPGSAKIPPCPKAELTLQVETDEGTAYVRCDLILSRNLEWRISSFFRCIGQKAHGEKCSPNWNAVVGARGRAHFKTRDYVNKNGENRTTNDVDKFYDYDESIMKAPVEGFIPYNGGSF